MTSFSTALICCVGNFEHYLVNAAKERSIFKGTQLLNRRKVKKICRKNSKLSGSSKTITMCSKKGLQFASDRKYLKISHKSSVIKSPSEPYSNFHSSYYIHNYIHTYDYLISVYVTHITNNTLVLSLESRWQLPSSANFPQRDNAKTLFA